MFSGRPSLGQGGYRFCGHSNETTLLSSPALKGIVMCFQTVDYATKFPKLLCGKMPNIIVSVDRLYASNVLGRIRH